MGRTLAAAVCCPRQEGWLAWEQEQRFVASRFSELLSSGHHPTCPPPVPSPAPTPVPSPGKTALDVGCGVGGPMRTVAAVRFAAWRGPGQQMGSESVTRTCSCILQLAACPTGRPAAYPPRQPYPANVLQRRQRGGHHHQRVPGAARHVPQREAGAGQPVQGGARQLPGHALRGAGVEKL